MEAATHKQPLDLPPLELECMKALWAMGEGTVHHLQERLRPRRPLAYTTVMTVMDRLARKGIVEREKKGRAHVYRPKFSEQEVRDYAVEKLVRTFFQGSREGLASHLNRSPQSPAAPSVSSEEPRWPAVAPQESAENPEQRPAGLDESLL